MKDFIQNSNQIFNDYVQNFGNNPNIVRKIVHSYVVATTCFEISSYLKLTERERELAYFVGLFHDIGRFSQWEKFKTYNDHNSVDHGDLSFEIMSKLQIDIITENEKSLVLKAIKFHNKPNFPADKKARLFTEIIKNADAYSNVITTANGSQQLFVEENGITQDILKSFESMKPLWSFSSKSKLDRILMLTACTYYVTFPFLRKRIIENNFIDIIYETYSVFLNSDDKKQLSKIISEFKTNYSKTAK